MYEFIPWVDSDQEQIYEKVLIAFEEHFRLMHSVALKLIRCLSLGLGKQAEYFDPWFKDECSSCFRAIRYMPRKDGGAGLELKAEELKLVTPEHADSGFITLLSTFMFQGLQVEIDGEYKSIQPVKNAIVVNIGETLQRISGHKIKATMHRVLDIGCERFSCPFFFDPKYSARISPILLSSARKSAEDCDYEQDPANSAEINQLDCFGKILCQKLTSAYGEWKGF